MGKEPAVTSILVHELTHAVVGVQAAHGRDFARVAKRLGLVGPMRTTTGSPELRDVLRAAVEPLGPYPHAAVAIGQGPSRKQTTWMLRLECPACGYRVRTTAKWISKGLPVPVLCGRRRRR